MVGHTDNKPVKSGYRSNLPLSIERAVSVMNYLIDRSGLNPLNFSSLGAGDTIPLAPNDTVENRAKNRRVEIFLLEDPENLENVGTGYVENVKNFVVDFLEKIKSN